MQEDIKTNKIIELINSAGNIAIMPSMVSGVDSFGAAAGLYFMLKEKGQNVSFIYQGPIPEEFEGIVAEDDVLRNITQRELVVSIDYSDTPASKVHYSTKDDILYLNIGPVNKDFNMQNIKSELKGFHFDLFITVGAQVLEDFGQVYDELRESMKSSDVINIDNTERNQKFGSVNVVEPQENSSSMVVFLNAPKWGLKPGSKAAKALLKGISHKDLN